MQKLKNLTPKQILTIAYVLLLTGGFLFVKSTLNEETIKITQKEEKQSSQDIKPVKVTLTLEQNGTKHEYKRKMQNNQTVLDLFRNLRAENILTYEKTEYVYGTELDIINNIQATENNKWKVYLKIEKEKYTDQVKNLKLSERR